jgi:hypothetical protein
MLIQNKIKNLKESRKLKVIVKLHVKDIDDQSKGRYGQVCNIKEKSIRVKS